MAEGDKSETIPGEAPREVLWSAHRGAGVKVLRLEGISARYIYIRGTGHVSHERA